MSWSFAHNELLLKKNFPSGGTDEPTLAITASGSGNTKTDGKKIEKMDRTVQASIGLMVKVILLTLFLPAAAGAQEPTISERLNSLEARVSKFSDQANRIEAKVDSLAARVDSIVLPKVVPPPTPPTQANPTTPPATLWPTPKTYLEARAQALARNVPLIVWVAGGLCPACVERTRDEFVHWIVPTFEGTVVADSIVVGVPEDGQLYRLDITSWTAGHIPTVRAAVAQFRANRLAARSQRIQARATYALPMIQYAPMMSYASVGVRGRACAGGG